MLRFLPSCQDNCLDCLPLNASVVSLSLSLLSVLSIIPPFPLSPSTLFHWLRYIPTTPSFDLLVGATLFGLSSSFLATLLLGSGWSIAVESWCHMGYLIIDLQSSWTFYFIWALAPYGSYGNWIYHRIHFLILARVADGLHSMAWIKM